MNQKYMGTQISSARKKLNYTQRELADKIGVSDKAVSKWERGIGCPDISLLLPLCEELDIDVSLLLGKENANEPSNEKDDALRLHQFAEYAKMKIIDHKTSILKYTTLFLCISSIISIGICLLVDYLILGHLSWSLTASASITYGCIIISTLLMCRNYWLEKSLAISSILLFPLLYVISMQVELETFFPEAYIIAIGAVIFAWLVYGILFHLHTSIWKRLILIIVLSTIHNVFINLYTNVDRISILIMLFSNIAGLIILFIIERIYKRKTKNKYE